MEVWLVMAGYGYKSPQVVEAFASREAAEALGTKREQDLFRLGQSLPP